ncbi:hypothetical protein M404DRAFT_994932 [Pisolithus tinctorius Marx 270]|uniref:Uncharacterized protein n=1 Tax=Pisolithus tinctorius Marx 270 TaxID=870435 RepID=A0A0C3PC01_PISTI|nr:hypothetical protein M404DRAFT_994932 [Pisolithus tinctorius Marx 270]
MTSKLPSAKGLDLPFVRVRNVRSEVPRVGRVYCAWSNPHAQLFKQHWAVVRSGF